MDPLIPPIHGIDDEPTPTGNGSPKPGDPAYAVVEEARLAGVPVEDEQPLLRHVGLAEREGDLKWYSPAVPSPVDRAGTVEGLLARIESTLGDHEGWRQYLRWTYHTRVKASAEELEATERQVLQSAEERARRVRALRGPIEEEIARLETDRPELERSLNDAADAYADAMGRAGLSGQPEDAAIGPRHVEEALQDVAPTVEEIAGEQGLVPPGEGAKAFGQVVLEGAAPIASGAMLALCIGTLTGLLSLIDLRNFDRPIVLLLAFVLGTVIVALIGGLVQMAVTTLAQYLEEAKRGTDEESTPRLRSRGVVITLLVAAAVFVVAEITAEAMGLRDLHLQRLISERRVGGGGGEGSTLLPFPLYLIVGTLISGPYVFYKAAKGWKESERTQRLAWLGHRRLERVQALTRSADVQAALHHARRAERLSNRLERLDERLAELREQRETIGESGLTDEMRARLEYATGTAIGESARLHQMVQEFVDEVDPLPGSPRRDNPSRATKPQSNSRAAR